jgi:hypothetical protein
VPSRDPKVARLVTTRPVGRPLALLNGPTADLALVRPPHIIHLPR